jgi:acetate kinase
MYVLVVNGGSSSIKYQLFDMSEERVLAKGLIANIMPDESVTAAVKDEITPRHVKNHEEGLKELFVALESAGAARHTAGALMQLATVWCMVDQRSMRRS